MSESARDDYLRELRQYRGEAVRLEQVLTRRISAVETDAREATALRELVAKVEGLHTSQPVIHTTSADYVGKTRHEMAVIVLRDKGEPMHIDAVVRGVQSRAFRDDPTARLRDTIMRSLNKAGKTGTEIRAYGRGHFGISPKVGGQARSVRSR
jgi:hypothetical protein